MKTGKIGMFKNPILNLSFRVNHLADIEARMLPSSARAMKHELAQLEAKLAADSQETRDAVHALLYCEVTHVARAFIASLDYLDLQSRVLPLSEEERTPQLLKFINERMMEFV